jgi:hypothetical protein
MARRDDREYREYLKEQEQRSQRGCIAVRMQMELHRGLLKSPGDPFGEPAGVADALQLVVGQLDREMLFEAGQEFEDLQAVDAERVEEIVVRPECRARDAKMCGGQIENLAGDVLNAAHRCRIVARGFSASAKATADPPKPWRRRAAPRYGK